MTQAYPLAWPPGWPRSQSQKPGRFKGDNGELTVAAGCDRVFDVLGKMGVYLDDVIISTDIQPTLSRRPRSSKKEPDDVGVAVYWNDPAGNERCIAIDLYNRVADNLAAIAATLEAMRAIERHGGAEILTRAFAGFVALPAPTKKTWWQILGVRENATSTEIKAAFRELASKYHPDKGGDPEMMAEINWAYRQAGGL